MGFPTKALRHLNFCMQSYILSMFRDKIKKMTNHLRTGFFSGGVGFHAPPPPPGVQRTEYAPQNKVKETYKIARLTHEIHSLT